MGEAGEFVDYYRGAAFEGLFGGLVIDVGMAVARARLTLSLLPMLACRRDFSPVIQGRSCPMKEAGSSQSRLGGNRSWSIKSRQRKQKI